MKESGRYTRLEQREEQKCRPRSDDLDLAIACDRYIDTIEDEMQWLQRQLDQDQQK